MRKSQSAADALAASYAAEQVTDYDPKQWDEDMASAYEDMATARGMVRGLLIGSAMWIAVGFGVWAVLW